MRPYQYMHRIISSLPYDENEDTAKYNEATERLWEKLEAHREKLDFGCVDIQKIFPWDQFVKHNPSARALLKETERELHYQLSEFQASWAVFMATKGIKLEDYNLRHGTSLDATS